jgi:hypothetical protein
MKHQIVKYNEIISDQGKLNDYMEEFNNQAFEFSNVLSNFLPTSIFGLINTDNAGSVPKHYFS